MPTNWASLQGCKNFSAERQRNFSAGRTHISPWIKADNQNDRTNKQPPLLPKGRSLKSFSRKKSLDILN